MNTNGELEPEEIPGNEIPKQGDWKSKLDNLARAFIRKNDAFERAQYAMWAARKEFVEAVKEECFSDETKQFFHVDGIVLVIEAAIAKPFPTVEKERLDRETSF